MFLKHYSGLSDEKLIEQLNANLDWQFFCGLLIPALDRIKDFKVVSKIRVELAGLLEGRQETLQKVLAKHWKPHMSNTNVMLVDATCYESSVRYPTDQKLLWESVEWVQEKLLASCKALRIRKPRTKFKKWALRYATYSHKRKRRIKERRSLTRGLVRLLGKLLGELDKLFTDYDWELTSRHAVRYQVIQEVYLQQWVYFYEGIKPEGRIVSLAKPWLRPIVRGKETKSVEFGAKVNKVQVDGISFIQKLSFNAFNEGIRLQHSIYLGRRLFGRIDVVGADAIYATNKNRRFCTARGIRNDFRRKGRAGKYEDQRKLLAKNVTRERASRLEGSFGTEKNHYLLHRIRARTRETEKLWIFMGIHTRNALEIGRRMTTKQDAAAA